MTQEDSVRITGNRMLELASLAANKAQDDVATLSAQLTSGKRVEKPSDDPEAWAQSRRLALRQVVSEGRGSALAFGQDQLNETDRALASIGTITAEAKELAIQAAADSLNARDRAALQERVNGLFELARTAANTRGVSGDYLLAGAQSDKEPFDAAGAYWGDAGTRQIETGEASLGEASVAGSVLTAASGVDVLPAIQRLATALGANDIVGIRKAIDEMTTAHTQVSVARTAVGDMSAVLADADDARGELELTLQGRIANMTEVDVLGAASELAKRTAALDAAQIVNARLAQMLQPK